MDEKRNRIKEEHFIEAREPDESTVTHEILPIDYSYSERVDDQDNFILPRNVFLDFKKEQQEEVLKDTDFMGPEDHNYFVYRKRDAKSEAYRKLDFDENATSKSFRHVPHKK